MRTSNGTTIATFELYWIAKRKWACGIIRRRGTQGSKYAYMYVGMARCYTDDPRSKCVFEGGPDPSVSRTTERTSARRSPPLTIKTDGNCIWAGAMIAIYDPDRSASTATGRTDRKGRFCNL
jgi:hypothetical protein